MIKILFTGDFCPHNRIERLVSDNRFNEIYNDFLPYLKSNDINITNLECPLVNTKSPISKFGPNLNASENCIKALKYGNFNLLTLSNNHIMDQGKQGLISTCKLCKKYNIEYVGVGDNLDEASKIIFKTIKDKDFAFLNFSENEFASAELNYAGANPLNPIRNYYSIKTARKKVDYVIAIVHGGHEGYALPSPRMIETYRFFIDAGADIVVGHHSHNYSGYENYNNGFIFYGLGNFIFDSPNNRNTDWNNGYSVKFYFNERKITFEIIPYKQCGEIPGIKLLDEKDKKIFEDNILKINNIVCHGELLLNEWEKYVQQRKNEYLIHFECFDSKIYYYLRSKKYIPSFLSKKKKLKLLNLIKCESHRDLVIKSLN